MFKNMIEAVRKGNAYRLEKYGKPDTISESFHKARAHVKWEEENIKPKTKFYWPWDVDFDLSIKKENEIKATYAYWDKWTGSRYERVSNPDQRLVTDRFSVYRKNIVTGELEF